MIPAEAIADVKARHDLVGFIESCGIALKRHGEAYLGLCPFHEDRSPSLSVSPAKQSWCCLGTCSAGGKVLGGDVVEFARRYWGVGFREALARLGGATTMALQGPRRAPLHVVGGRKAVRPPVPADLLGQVATVYHQAFLASAEAKAYAVSRGLTNPDLLAALPIGYADGSLLERAPEGSETHAGLKTLGVLTAGGRELLAGCLVVPLRDLSSAVVSLYGRRIESDGHLYLPGPRRGLVNAASAATCDELILAESVIDALSFLQAGLPGAIPLYGTNGWTPDHDALLEAHRIRRVILALDADEAGRKAAQALGEKLRAKGIDVLDIRLPVKDPNQLLVAEGPEGFRETWRRLVSAEAKRPGAGPAAGTVALAAAPALTPAREDPAKAAAKEENGDALALTCDEPGAYRLHRGLRTWLVKGLLAHGVDRLRINLRVDQGPRFHVNTFDLYSARSRNAFVEASVKALRLDESEEAPIADEIADLIAAMEKERLALRKQGKGEAEAPAMSAADREEALGFLRGDIVGALKKDFEALGLVGEVTALLIGYFALISRKLPKPLSVLFCARSGAGKSVLQDALCELVPPEDLVKYTRISGQVLFYKGEHALTHKVLAVDEEDGAAMATYALRSLLSTGELRSSVTKTDPRTGRQSAEDYLAKGPTSVMTTTAHPEALDYETRNRFVLLTVDESREQTERILERQWWDQTVEGLLASEKKSAIARRHHNAQKLLDPVKAVIPFAVSFPKGYLILRREQKKYVTLLQSIALLHQHQRPRKTARTEDGNTVEYIEVTEEDVSIARPLASLILKRNLDELAPPARSLYVAMRDLSLAKRAALARDESDPMGGKSEPKKSGAPRRYVLGSGEGERDERLCLERREIQRGTGLSLWHIKTYMPQLIEYEYAVQVSGSKGKRCLYEVLDAEEPEELNL